MTQSYYKQLVEAGIHIYEYTPGFIHAKCFASDDKVATVGTINMDYRSLYLHFEDGVWMYKNDVILDIRDDFTETLEYCDPIDLAFCQKRNIVVRAIQNVLESFLHRYYKNSLTDNCKFCMIYQTGVKCSRLILSKRKIIYRYI